MTVPIDNLYTDCTSSFLFEYNSFIFIPIILNVLLSFQTIIFHFMFLCFRLNFLFSTISSYDIESRLLILVISPSRGCLVCLVGVDEEIDPRDGQKSLNLKQNEEKWNRTRGELNWIS